MKASNLSETLARLSARAASSVVARGRIDSHALNAALLRRLSAQPGENDSFLADPVFETAHVWKTADCTMEDLSGGLLSPQLIAALDGAATEKVPRTRQPWVHQFDAWRAAREGHSCLISSGTGSGKTECFMIPMLDDLLRDPAKGKLVGVRAIVIYPLNALIESQRERLADWTRELKSRISFAMYNGFTPETRREQDRDRLAAAEIGNRRDIREMPPSILVTNVTMLEYLLLRATDHPILEKSKELLRWVVLDEAHSYIGAQAAEMALLLRRVRAAFGVRPDQVRLMATSATISEGEESDSERKLKQFTSKLAGLPEDRVRIVWGRTEIPQLPEPSADTPLDPQALEQLDAEELWQHLAPHPRIQSLKQAMADKGVALSRASDILFGSNTIERTVDAQRILDLAAQARCPDTEVALLPWRAHIFHRPQGGFWVCVDPSCRHRDPELAEKDSGWGFGAVWLTKRDACDCGAPVFELFACDECGTPYLKAGFKAGMLCRLVPLREPELDDFAIDAEPDIDANLEDGSEQADDGPSVYAEMLLTPATNSSENRYLNLDDGTVYDNEPPADAQYVAIAMIEHEVERECCPGASRARLAPQRYSSPFLMGASMPSLVEALSETHGRPGLPMGGRRAITFSDSRQGTARLAAKLQQEAERNLTRAFLYHAVQKDRGPQGEEREVLERKLDSFRRANDPEFEENIREIEEELAGHAKPIRWENLVDEFSQQAELCEFATEVWRERRYGKDLAQDPRKLAEMFLYRELFRRPRVQNNAETMGLLRLSFPTLEARARQNIPSVLREHGIDQDDWLGVVLSAVDFVFRDRLASQIQPEWMVRLISPRGSRRPNSICRASLDRADRPPRSYPWPNPVPHPGRPSRLHRLVYSLISGDWEDKLDQDRADEVLSALWTLITESKTAIDVGAGAFRLDFSTVAADRLDQGWLCPVTRRIFGYSPANRSPYDPSRKFIEVRFPRLQHANAGGLDRDLRREVVHWYEASEEITALRKEGLWTNLHDRVAAYAPFLRAQEHSAQIKRAVLANYEKQFKGGRVNLLNCSTTMEMGIDIPNVQIVANANVPPSISNYRQRLGRAGRRDEPWAFGITFCRDLPLDWSVFNQPAKFLSAPVTAPVVRLDSPSIVARHVHAALLATYLRSQSEGIDLRTSAGSFFGASEDASEPIGHNAPADGFLYALRGEWGRSSELEPSLKYLAQDTLFEKKSMADLVGMTASRFEEIVTQWRDEYNQILARREARNETEVKKAFDFRARRMRGEFLIAELARRGFTPSYGFPVDVVSFDHLSGHARDDDRESYSFGERRGGASRTLEIAIREYAPGVEIVVDGLVHRSEGILPAWDAMADTSKREDLQDLWECDACRAFWLARIDYDACPQCDAPSPKRKRTLRPAGFLGRREPHTSYENLGHAPYEAPRLSASDAFWQALPDVGIGRLRADPNGQVVVLGSSHHGKGYAVCLVCGRAEIEEGGSPHPLPEQIKKHEPLAIGQGSKLERGYCPGGFTELEKIQRNVRFIHSFRTDIFELQLPHGSNKNAGRALAAALREALAKRLGTEVRDIGISAERSQGPLGESRVSAFLYDRASGGAGLSSRLSDMGWFEGCMRHAVQQLSCPENCKHGCSACVLRPDISFLGDKLDREEGQILANKLISGLRIPKEVQVFGPETRLLGQPLLQWLDGRRRLGLITSITVYMHGRPEDWELARWEAEGLFLRMKKSGVSVSLVMESQVLDAEKIELAQKLDLHRFSAHASLFQTHELPKINNVPLLLIAEDNQGLVGIATQDLNEGMPSQSWGQGEKAALVCGPVPALPENQDLDWARIVRQSSTNARIIRVGGKLDGEIKAFGRNFWKLLTQESEPLGRALKTYKVQAIAYTDRYLLTPLSIRLLYEVIQKTPMTTETLVSVRTARYARASQQGKAVFHAFPDDSVRKSVVEAMLPNADILIGSKAELPHARTLKIQFENESSVLIHLDQGFGAWRVDGWPKHDFSAKSEDQARLLKSTSFSVSVEGNSEAPIVLETE